ncbi:MAG: acyl-CoA thioesterase [Deltaproteobacteria bacterium]|nr:acyl-CoA thioesterase [Deltaproteobacteria bacterium]
MSREFRVELQVRDNELDQFGMVNNAVYLNYMQHARHEYLIHLGLDAAQTAHSGLAWALSQITIRYRAPLKSRDRLTVSAAVTAVSGARVTFSQQCRILPHNTLAAEGEAVAVMLDAVGRPLRIPPHERRIFTLEMAGSTPDAV